jgi:hypothetical protein
LADGYREVDGRLIKSWREVDGGSDICVEETSENRYNKILKKNHLLHAVKNRVKEKTNYFL